MHHQVYFDPVKVLFACDAFFRSIIEQRTSEYLCDNSKFGVYLVTDPTIKQHVKKELEAFEAVFNEAVERYYRQKDGEILLHNLFK